MPRWSLTTTLRCGWAPTRRGIFPCWGCGARGRTVFNGNVEGQQGGDTTVVSKKQSLTLEANQVAVAKKIQGEPYDEWDKESIDYHKRYAAANAAVAGGNAYGVSDLNYYGNFINAGGSSFWQPFFLGAGWRPYAGG